MGAVGWLPPWDQNRSLRDITFREEMLLPCEHGSITALRLKRVIYQDKSTVSQKTCHAAKRFQRMGFLSSCGVTTFSCIETFIAHLSCAFF